MFAGMEYDRTTGLYYDHTRYYYTAIGRFVSQDRAGFAAGDTDLYRYVGNEPTGATDVSGLAGPGRTNGVKNNQDGSSKELGQNYGELGEAQRMGGGRRRARIRSTKKSKQDDKKEINQLGEDALLKVGVTSIIVGVLWFLWEVPARLFPYRDLIPN
jgi:RHS repeat-associated protein